MPRPQAIPEKLHEAVLAKAGEGASTRQISSWLKATHKITAGFNAVARFLRERKAERREVAQAVVAERVAKGLTADLDSIAERKRQLGAVIDGLLEGMVPDENGERPNLLDKIGQTPRASVLARVVAEFRGLSALELDHSGLGGDNDPKKTGVRIWLPPPEDAE